MYFVGQPEPDHYLESFWGDFKNFIKLVITNIPVILSDNIKLDEWVHTLNVLKTNREYVNIEHQIEKYMATVGWVLLKYLDSYYYNIYVTNLKRWHKVPSICEEENRKAKSKSYFKHLKDDGLDLYTELLGNLTKKDKLENPIYVKLYSLLQIPDYNSDIKKTIDYNISNLYEVIPELLVDKRESCLNTVSKYINMKVYLKENYNFDLKTKNMSAKKYLPLFSNYLDNQ